MKIQVDTINKKIYFESDSEVTTRVMSVTINTLSRRIFRIIRENINNYTIIIEEPIFEPDSKEYIIELTTQEIGRIRIQDVLRGLKIRTLLDDALKGQLPNVINVNYILQ